jgi:hypothetical protein
MTHNNVFNRDDSIAKAVQAAALIKKTDVNLLKIINLELDRPYDSLNSELRGIPRGGLLGTRVKTVRPRPLKKVVG